MKLLRKAFARFKPKSPFEAVLLTTLLLFAVGVVGLTLTLGAVIDANLTLADELKGSRVLIGAEQSGEAAVPYFQALRVAMTLTSPP
jgi:hypothetical protein